MSADGRITIRYLQYYLGQKDCNRSDPAAYFLKLSEEAGELARVLARDVPPATEETFKGSAEEELWDVLYYALCIANLNDIDLERWIPKKERIYASRHPDARTLEPDCRPDPQRSRGRFTVRGLQRHFVQKARDPRGVLYYYCKLCEELGEAIRVEIRGYAPATEEAFPGTLEDALCDVVSYVMVLADLLHVDLERWIPFKEALNAKKWHQELAFEP